MEPKSHLEAHLIVFRKCRCHRFLVPRLILAPFFKPTKRPMLAIDNMETFTGLPLGLREGKSFEPWPTRATRLESEDRAARLEREVQVLRASMERLQDASLVMM